MNPSKNPGQGSPVERRLPWTVGFLLGLLLWEVLPWAIAQLTPHFGWTAGRPGPWNLLGLIPVLVGTAGFVWGVKRHAAHSLQGVDWQLEKSYLLTDGLYARSRNPMYLSELTLLFGWAIFYGSVTVLVAFVLWWAFFNFFAIPQEERVMEAHFGETYREYKNRVRRWL